MPSRIPVQKIKLSNKATLLVEENHATPIVSICAYFLGGVRAENRAHNGISYFTQKVLLKGTEHLTADELAFQTEEIGSSFGLLNEKDAFGVHASVLSKHFDKTFDLFLETLFHPSFPAEEVEKEREVIIAEIEERKDEIYSHCLQLCDKALFSHHPYQFPTKGEIESINSLQRDDLAKWHQQWYQTANMVFSIVGDISAERVSEKIVTNLEKLPKGKAPKIVLPSENGSPKREIIVESDKRQLAMAIGFVAPSATEDDRFAFEVLGGLLSGMGSRLFIELRDKKGLCYSVGSRYDVQLDHGIFKTYMGTAVEQEVAARDGLLEELFRLRDTLADAEELQRTKRHLIGLYEIRRQKNSSQAMRYARYESLGLGWRIANQYPKKIEGVAAETVGQLARKYLEPNKYALSVVRPKK